MTNSKIFLWVSVAFAILAASIPACTCAPPCGKSFPPKGQLGVMCSACNKQYPCAGDLECINGACRITNVFPDGGLVPDGGQILPDGGYCFNLQCKQVGCSGASTTSISGTVYDPSGTVPLYNALVYVPNTSLSPFPAGALCARCGAPVDGNPVVQTLTDSAGNFTLTNVPPGSNIPLVFEIGKWRRQVSIPTVTACQNTALTDPNLERMPRNRSEGNMPRMAISTGSADPFQCLLYKMQIDPNEFTLPGQGGDIDYYVENGMPLWSGSDPGSDLWSDAGNLLNYDVVLLPCEGGANAKPNNAISNVVNYLNQGGRVFATHYSYEWLAVTGGGCTSNCITNGGFPTAADWSQVDAQHPSDPFPFSAYVQTNLPWGKTFPKGAAFQQWLGNVNALGGGMLPIDQSRHDVIGVNWDGGTFEWLYNPNFPDVNTGLNHYAVEHMTWNTPYGGDPNKQCGRLVFSDFHVTGNDLNLSATYQFPTACLPLSQSAFTPQEKALIFMLFDVSNCVQNDQVAPTVCNAAGTACSGQSNCCSGLLCVDPNFNLCDGGICQCEPVIN